MLPRGVFLLLFASKAALRLWLVATLPVLILRGQVEIFVSSIFLLLPP